jgi:cardiolipin synthase
MIALGIGLQIGLMIIGVFVARAAITTARTPQGAAAWVVFLVSFPLLALPAFAVFGSVSRLSSRPRKKHVPADQVIPVQGRIERLARITGAQVTKGNEATLLIDGRQTFDAIFAAIDSAEHEILVQFYIIRADDIGLELQQRLIAAARRGVKIRVLCDMIGSLFLGRGYMRVLEAEGIRIRGIYGPHRALGRIGVNFRNHRKAVVVDGRVGFTGGINVGDEYLDGGKHFDSWRDTHLRVKGPMVGQLRDIFASDWAGVTGETLEKMPPPRAVGPFTGLMAGFGPTDRLERGSLFLCALANLADRRLWITTPYLVPHTDLLSALQLAALRGVDVRILVPHHSDNIVAWYATRNAAQGLSLSGVEVFEYQPGFMHSKVVLVDDDIASVGTVNLDIRSALLNFEETAVIEDKAFAAGVDAMLRRDFDQATKLETPGPWHVRLLSPMARLFGPLL